jgi:hypothetical protein
MCNFYISRFVCIGVKTRLSQYFMEKRCAANQSDVVIFKSTNTAHFLNYVIK